MQSVLLDDAISSCYNKQLLNRAIKYS